MASDDRSSYKKRTAVLDLASGTSVVQTVENLRPEETFAIDYIKVEYDSGGGVASDLEFYDDPDGTSAGNLNNRFEKFKIQGGDRIIIDDVTYDDVEDDILINPDGNQDAEVTITVSGRVVTG